MTTDVATDAPTFDLQSHSTYSDGLLPPAHVVALAAAAGVELLALSDHDTVEGVDEALDAARKHGIKLVPAVEISAPDGAHPDIHVLGYGIDHHDEALLERLAAYRADRDGRADRMIANLRELGWELDERPIAHRQAQGKPIGRPHIAAAVFAHPANQERLQEEGLTDPPAVLVAYLIEGAPAFAGRTIPTVEDAIEVIHAAGGVAVWAHPFWDIKDRDQVLETLDRYVSYGLDGVEAFYTTHAPEQNLLLADRAAELGLLTTGSADFHGPEHRHFKHFRAFDLCGREPNLGPIAQ
ncbi:MAG TPA: PHP domain-containing protein [Capillimicrobium sp.]|nr:PHP domain-containing protein [Capillimicrobium sp.]